MERNGTEAVEGEVRPVLADAGGGDEVFRLEVCEDHGEELVDVCERRGGAAGLGRHGSATAGRVGAGCMWARVWAERGIRKEAGTPRETIYRPLTSTHG